MRIALHIIGFALMVGSGFAASHRFDGADLAWVLGIVIAVAVGIALRKWADDPD